MGNSSLIGKIEKEFSQQFTNVELSYEAITLGKGLIQTFFIDCSSKEFLKDNWRKISNFLAVNFQNTLENDFERWNLYIFFLIKQEISNDLKYQIENDTFSSRKIVVAPGEKQADIIKYHILNDDLSIGESSKKASADEFQPNKLVWKILKGKTLKKVKMTSEAQKSFNKLVEIIKKDTHEI